MTSTSEQPSEKSLELATRYVRMFKGDPAQHQNALNTLAIQFDEARKDGLKRAAEIAEAERLSAVKNNFTISWRQCAETVRDAILMEAGEKK